MGSIGLANEESSMSSVRPVQQSSSDELAILMMMMNDDGAGRGSIGQNRTGYRV